MTQRTFVAVHALARDRKLWQVVQFIVLEKVMSLATLNMPETGFVEVRRREP